MKRLSLEQDLRQAIIHEEFVLEYQPITELSTSQLLGFEALIRWNHPINGVIPPSEFIPIAEQTGMIISIGEWVFKTACQQIKEWEIKYSSAKHLTISINVSGKQLCHKDFHKTVESMARVNALEPTRINLEITESVILEDNPDLHDTLLNLAKQGFSLQLDDFGIGQSSLGYIQKYPLSTIKIDRSFISLMHQKREHGLIQSIIQLAKALDLKTIAEGITSTDQEAVLKSFDCDSGQGFGISKPISANKIDHLLKEQNDTATYYLPVRNFPV
ncbi:MAG: EAL domain-containing protein [Anaerolineales bacterium]|nr:EAL domain-containing protein [Anaerolineales bacterium]